jgi:isopenicillin N synthase-like dioxygenase
MDQIPVVDVSGLDSQEAARRREVAEQLGQACRSIGFLYVANHGISEGTRNAVFAAAKAFFDLPSTAKEEFSVRGMGSPDVRRLRRY